MSTDPADDSDTMGEESPHRPARTASRWANKPAAAAAILVGGTLVLIGVAAPLVAGPRGEFLGFGRNYLHDAVHLASGLAGLAAGLYARGRFARGYDLAFGGVYLLVALLGVALFGLLADLLALNHADNVLHFMLAFALLGVGYISRDLIRERDRRG